MNFTPEIERVLNDAVFLICALVALVSAGLVITRRNPVYATFLLLPMFIAMAVLFVLLSAPFMAAMQVLVYGGAIVVVFLFVINLLNLGPEDLLAEGGPGRWVVAGIAGALLFGLMAAPVVTAFTSDGALQAFPGQDEMPLPEKFGGISAAFGSTKAIAGTMFQNYLVPFELAGILLVVGIMGALLLSKERLRRPGDEVDTDTDTDSDADTAADGTTEEETHV